MDVKIAAISKPTVAKVKQPSPQEHVAALDFAAGLEDVFAADIIEQNSVKADADLHQGPLNVAKVTTREELDQLPPATALHDPPLLAGVRRVWCTFLVPINALQVIGKRVAQSISIESVKRLLQRVKQAALKHGGTAVKVAKGVAWAAKKVAGGAWGLGKSIVNGVQRFWRWAFGGNG